MSGYVYFFGTGDGKVKIGKANNVEARFRQIKTASPTGLEILAKVEDENPFELESKLHLFFKEKRLKGEWFEISREEVSSVVKKIQVGYKKNPCVAIKMSLDYWEEIMKEISETSPSIQCSGYFFSHEDAEFLLSQIDKLKGVNSHKRYSTLITMLKELQFSLWMLAQANGYEGYDYDVNLQSAGRDILGFVRIVQRHLMFHEDRWMYFEESQPEALEV